MSRSVVRAATRLVRSARLGHWSQGKGPQRTGTMFECTDWKLLRISGGLAGSIFKGRAIKWIMNRNHQRRGNRPVKACAKRRRATKQKTRAKRDTIWPKALIASKNALKAPMEKARKKNRRVE